MRGRNGSDSGKRPYLKPGVWRVTDDLSGFQKGSDEVKKTWDGFLATPGEGWYVRQPQDFPLLTRGVTSVIDARPLNSYTVEGAYDYHVAGTTPDNNYLVFQDNSYIGFKFYQNEYIGDIPSE